MSLEVRWILHGLVPTAMIEWLGPFADAIERREDQYLVNPSSEEFGVKIKGGILLDLKALRGTAGTLALPEAGRGHLEIWEKWSFSVDAVGALARQLIELAHRSEGPAPAFVPVVRGGVIERDMGEAEMPGCTVELTEIAIGDAMWWSLGLEVHGRSETLDTTLHATVESLFRGPPPDGIQLDLRTSMSYPRWLGTRV